MKERQHIQVPPGRRIFEVLQEHSKNKRPPLSEEEKARREAEDEAFDKLCDEIFQQVCPELVKDHYNWAIMIEPNSGWTCFPTPALALVSRFTTKSVEHATPQTFPSINARITIDFLL